MVKKNQSVSIDVDLYVKAQKLGINISKVCNDALKGAVGPSLDEKEIRDELGKTKTTVSLLEQKLEQVENERINDKAKQQALEQFLECGPNIIYMQSDMQKWSERTGKSVEELIQIKRSRK